MTYNSLKNILDDNIEGHKIDIRKIARSVLLNKSESNNSQQIDRWSSIKSLKPPDNNKFKTKIGANTQKEDTFNSRMLMFAIGPDTIGNSKPNKKMKPKSVKLRALNVNNGLEDLINQRVISTSPQSNEDLKIVNRSPERYSFTSPRYLHRDHQLDNEEEIKSSSIDLIPHYIHPRYKTQYEQLIHFRSENIREGDQREQNLLKGTNLIRHLEIKLQKNLENLDKIGRAPNFVRLQVFSNILNDLISESWMFAPLLIRIKSAYDDEVIRILEMPVTNKELLSSEMEQLKSSIFNKEKLLNLQSESHQLEEAINVCLQSEDQSRKLLTEEELKLEEIIKEKTKFDEEKKRLYKPQPIAVIPTESEKLEILKVRCWDLMDDISRIQKETRQKLVPRATIGHLSEGLHDIGIEVEKLNYHKSQLTSETEEMSQELYEYIDEDFIREEDFRLIETLLNSPSPISFDNYQESNKWSWYIS